MESRNARLRKSLWLAVGTSLLMHLAVLFIGFSTSDLPAGPSGTASATQPRLLATLASPPTPTPPTPTPPPRRTATAPNTVRKPAAARARSTEKPKLTAPTGAFATRSWSAAERADMNKFLDELVVEAKAPSAGVLSEKARAMARQMRSPEQGDGEDPATLPVTKGNGADPYSLELYFEAFVRKMNRSAAFVSNDPARRRGSRKALVEISLNRCLTSNKKHLS